MPRGLEAVTAFAAVNLFTAGAVIVYLRPAWVMPAWLEARDRVGSAALDRPQPG